MSLTGCAKTCWQAGAVVGEQDRVLFPKQMVMARRRLGGKDIRFFTAAMKTDRSKLVEDRVFFGHPVVQPFRRSIWTQAYTAPANIDRSARIHPPSGYFGERQLVYQVLRRNGCPRRIRSGRQHGLCLGQEHDQNRLLHHSLWRNMLRPLSIFLDIVAGGTGEFSKRPFFEGPHQPGHLTLALWRRCCGSCL